MSTKWTWSKLKWTGLNWLDFVTKKGHGAMVNLKDPAPLTHTVPPVWDGVKAWVKD